MSRYEFTNFEPINSSAFDEAQYLIQSCEGSSGNNTTISLKGLNKEKAKAVSAILMLAYAKVIEEHTGNDFIMMQTLDALEQHTTGIPVNNPSNGDLMGTMYFKLEENGDTVIILPLPKDRDFPTFQMKDVIEKMKKNILYGRKTDEKGNEGYPLDNIQDAEAIKQILSSLTNLHSNPTHADTAQTKGTPQVIENGFHYNGERYHLVTLPPPLYRDILRHESPKIASRAH